MAKRQKKKKPASSPEPSTRRTDVAELHTALAAGAVPVLVDVRSGFEFSSGHVAGSVNIPLGAIGSAELPDADEVWVICRSGNRSAAAAAQLQARGKRVVDVAGGTTAWSAAGHPLAGRNLLAELAMPAMASLTLGLAPFVPEPHLVGKLRWVAGGAVGMGPMDWFDLVMHGAPWVWLLLAAGRALTRR